MQPLLSATGLTKRFRKRTVVDNLSFAVPAGIISAFLGPNGAGKTTTIRLLLGLLKPHAGSCQVLGFAPGDPRALAQIGAMVEQACLYDHLTGWENLRITQLMRNCALSEIERVLSIVDMCKDAKRPVREYSLGMRQRLGVALALMGQPKLLILDEPTNGLDPIGIQEMRTLIRGLATDMGVTIFLSSHILAEVEQIATRVVVIHHGRLCYEGPINEMGEPLSSHLWVRVQDSSSALNVFSQLRLPWEEHKDGFLVNLGKGQAPELAQALVQSGTGLLELSPYQENLESRFLALLKKDSV